ncbi:MAG: hypothetical protein IJ797_06570 [Selenomonadaceae bacterium]|nr:hypothetical protein [Selenomonadaceae bacterium]
MIDDIDINDKKAVRFAGYKVLINRLGIEDTIKFMRHFYDEAAGKDENHQPDISWQQCLNEIEQCRR